MRFRIGINLGDVMVEGDNLMGDGINVAARLHTMAPPGGICIAGSVHEQVRYKLALNWDDLGDQTVKNIAEPVRVYSLQLAGRPASHRPAWPMMVTRRRLGVAATILVALLAIAAVAAYVARIGPLSPRCDRASIAVLPFANLSGDPAQDYFSDGTTEDVIAALGRFSDLAVTAYVAVKPYKGRPISHDEINRELGVCYVLTGSVRKNGDRALVTTQLIDALTGRLLGSDSYDGDLQDPFLLRNQITLWVVGKLAVKIQDLEKHRALHKPTDRLDAYDLVLRGRDLFAHYSRADNSQARRLFTQAVELDPNYASAYAGLGMTLMTAAVSGWTEFWEDDLRQAQALAEKAIELDDDSAEAHRLLGDVYFNRGQFTPALSEADRAIELNPNDALSYATRGSILLYTGHAGDAVQNFEIAKRLNPAMGGGRLDPVGWAYYLTRRYEDALNALTAGTRTNPDDFFIYAGLAATYAQLGRDAEAKQAAGNVLHSWPFFRVDTFVSQFGTDADRALVADGLHKAGLK
jgi:TolB-like protein/Flp pilus assembly protein TadD